MLHRQAADTGVQRLNGSMLTPPSDSGGDGLDRVIANINAKGPDGITPLMLAACNRTTDYNSQGPQMPNPMDQGLLYANPMAQGGYYGIPASGKPESFLCQLLSLGADHQAKTFSSEETALHLAARCGLAENVRLLLQFGADINSGDVIGATPLHAAVASGAATVVQVSETFDLKSPVLVC